ncbi:glycosidase [Haematobacter massiliensis]|uniref:Uncharacterized protein n=1 Tax=Haematobacter massiliensis TaxID=195105 RepID=A0A086YC16_9RHOB|nr:DUF2840 domain-containing protein [Haematobacter massiliensis]KFI31816.1 hypothetical protein CN97_05155 [Haematobacter massiliensis]OWJ72202.1 glycosidase [Haematobacter massiliensis]OWJ87772.1 glycosidase [Haematobacter massiliensis]QBJ24209.1 DUF2840 domain-containing protein [Haematobacter massiliensis]
MSGRPSHRAHGRPLPDGPAPFTTLVELTFEKRRVEHRIRFGRKAYEQILDRRRSVVGFAPESIFAFVRWAAGEHGTIVSRIDIVRAIGRGDPFQTLPFVRPGGEILLRLDGWPKVQRALAAIDAVEALGLDATDASPDHWRQVHNRLSAGQEPTAYTPERHAAWIGRRRIDP